MVDKPPRRRSPQEKKHLSYERDRVNVYGENDKASRKAIPRFKAASHRGERHAARTLVERMGGTEDETLDAALADVTLTPPAKQKVPDVPLGLNLDERPFKRRAGADRKPTRNRRESVRALVEQVSMYEGFRRPPDKGTE